MRTLDEIDKKILNRLRQNGRISLKELSAEVFLTMPAVSARIEKLEKKATSGATMLLWIWPSWVTALRPLS